MRENDAVKHLFVAATSLMLTSAEARADETAAQETTRCEPSDAACRDRRNDDFIDARMNVTDWRCAHVLSA
jgi:hypothetical protein